MASSDIRELTYGSLITSPVYLKSPVSLHHPKFAACRDYERRRALLTRNLIRLEKKEKHNTGRKLFITLSATGCLSGCIRMRSVRLRMHMNRPFGQLWEQQLSSSTVRAGY